MNTIYDPTKIGNQCSEEISNKIDNELKELKQKPSKYKIKRTIKDYYEFYGYLEFANKLVRLSKNIIGNRELDKKERNKILIKVIKDYCSNRILIIDEVHNLRERKR